MLQFQHLFQDVLQDIPREYREAFQTQLIFESLERGRLFFIVGLITHIPVIYFIDIQDAFAFTSTQRVAAILMHGLMVGFQLVFVWQASIRDTNDIERRRLMLFILSIPLGLIVAQSYVWLAFVRFQHTIIFAVSMLGFAFIFQLPKARYGLAFYSLNLIIFLVIVISYQNDPLRFADHFLTGSFTVIFAWVQSQILIKTRANAFVNEKLLEQERERTEQLLLNILPEEIAAILKKDNRIIADYFDDVSILFADVVNFTPMSAKLTPTKLVELLNEVFSHFDTLVEKHGIEKIKTIGDCYMVAAGVPRARPDHAHVLARLALDIRNYASEHEFQGHRLAFRIGLNSGSVVAGVIGRRKFTYDLWGDAVNIASRMESHGTGGFVQVTESTYQLIKDDFICEPRGTITVKGKGEMKIWYVQDKNDKSRPTMRAGDGLAHG